MRAFRSGRAGSGNAEAVSIKIRVTSGCFHREHSPEAYRLIDDSLRAIPGPDRTFDLLEHESGPEVLVYVALATAGITLAKSVIDLVVAILKARSEGVRKGDPPAYALEVIVRKSADEARVDEEIVLRLGHSETVRTEHVEKCLTDAIRKLLRDPAAQTGPANRALQPASRARRKTKARRS